MRTEFLILLLILTLNCSAQNLVPNGNFENNTNGLVSDWIQPRGQYYHYSTYLKRVNENIVYNSENGLCLLNTNASEYLVVQLKERLKAGYEYCVKIDVRIVEAYIGNVWDLNNVEIAFSAFEPVVKSRTKLYMTPEISFQFDTLKPYFEFQHFEQKYTAKGDENFMVIGRFFSQETDSMLRIKQKTVDELMKEKTLKNNAIRDSFLRMYPPITAVDNKHAGRKEIKRMSDSIGLIGKLRNEAMLELEDEYEEKIKNAKGITTGYSYHIRTHFDNVCVAPFKNNMCNCEEDEEKESYEPGRSYILQNIHFDLDKATLKEESYPEIDNLFQVLIQNPSMIIQINGHTDSLNTETYNMDLSMRRAKTVAEYLISKGISPQRLKWKGYGETLPLTNNTTEEGRAMNRRVEFIVLKK